MNDWESFGAVLAVVSAFVSNLGVNIQKYSHANEAKLPDHEQRPYIQRPVWWFGLLLVVTGSLGDFSAFGFATQSLVAALGGGSTLVANVLTAHYLNKESLYKTDIAGVIFVIIGVVIIAWIAEPNVEYPLPELEKRFVRTEFVIYIVTVVVCTVSMLATIKGSMANRLKNQVYWSKRRQKQLMKQFEVRIQRVERRIIALEEELIEARGGDKRSKTTDIRSGEQLAVEQVGDIVDGVVCPDRAPYYYAICAGIVGAVTVLLAKCSAVMIALSLKGDNQFKYGLTYVFIGGMFVCILVQTHLLNMATSLGDIMSVFPIFQAFWIIFSVIGGAVFYESEKDFTVEKWILYPMAMISIATGVLLLVQHGSSNSHTEKGLKNDFGVDDSIDMMADASMISPLLPPESKGYLEA